MPRSTECEVRLTVGRWTVATAEEAVKFGKAVDKRCIECHGRVRAHKGGDWGAAHIEHIQKNSGCTLGAHYDGSGKRNHRMPLE